MSGRVLCVTVASASGHVIIERFYEPTSERDQMMWRRRLHEASASSVADGGAATTSAGDFARAGETCEVAWHGEECMAWCRVGDVRFYAIGSGQYDELALVEVIQALVDSVAGLVKKHFDEARVFEHYGMICLALDEIVSDGVAEATSWDAIRRGIKLKMSS